MKKLKAYIPTVLAAALILYLSLLREPHFAMPLNGIVPYADKLMHALMYLILGAIVAHDTYRLTSAATLRIFIICLLSITAYGGAIELLQEYCFPPRHGEWLDLLADAVGAAAGLALCYKFVHQFRHSL